MSEQTKKRILVIDDAGLIRMYYRDALEHAGYDVEEAINGLEALEKLLTARADLLIVDINMPQMDGLTFLKTLRRHESDIAAIPAMVTSTESANQDRAAALAAGANHYLIKPVTKEELVRCVAMLCGDPA
jgi:two-component system chemotaxis response regulator CheY